MSPLLFAIIFVQQTISIVVKQVDLTPTNTNQNDATITEGAYTTNDVTVDAVNAEWDILVNANSQRGYHLEIDLNNAWGFHSNKESSISFTMNSSTIITQDELHLLVTFSVNNNSYITYFLSLDTLHVNNVHPANCDTSTSPTQSLATGSVKSCVDDNFCSAASSEFRDCKATGACQYNAILPNNIGGFHYNSWPLTITLLNNPITNTLFATISSPSWSGWTQGCGFGESFATNSGLQIYIGVDAQGESISFRNFHIEYSYDAANGPTQHPTENPTANPTEIQATTTAAPMTYTTINGTWSNDFVAAPPSGWLLTVNGNPTQYSSITTFNMGTYDGPFVGISSGSRDIYHLWQQFYCAEPSSVEITYRMVYCGTDTFDYLRTADDLPSSTVYGVSGFELTDPGLNTICNKGWHWRGEFNAIIPFVPVASLFKVGFEISVDSDTEAIGIRQLKVECKPTSQSPTTAPPTAPPISSPITSTASPTTKAPITSTALQTIAPSKQPTNIPSKQPRNYPSKQPTNYPSKQPTNNPTTQSTNNPSTQSPSNQSAEPSEAPSSNNPTATPNVSGWITTLPLSTPTNTSEAENDENPHKSNDKPSHWIYVVIVCIILFCVLAAVLGVYKLKQRKSIKKIEVVEENMDEQIKKMSLEQAEMVNIYKDKHKEGSGGGELFENVESGHMTSAFSDIDDSDEHIDGEDEDESMYNTPKQNIGATPTLFSNGFSDNDINKKQDENEGMSIYSSPRSDANTLITEKNNVENWNTDDVVMWIGSIQRGKFKIYSNLFREQNIRGTDLKAIEKTDLCDFGINIFSHRNDIFNEIQKLQLMEEGDV